MGKAEKLVAKVLAGDSDANIGFADLCGMLAHCGFKVRIRGAHHIFTRPGVPEILNLQPLPGGKSKPYQVKQVRAILARQQPP